MVDVWFVGAFVLIVQLSECRWLIGIVGEKVRRERRWTSAGETPARELVRSTR